MEIVETRVDAAVHDKLDRILEYTDKTLNLTSVHADEFGTKCGRPYYNMNDGWGLTSLYTEQPFFVNTRDRNITPWLVMSGEWEPWVSKVLSTYAQPGMSFVDIGANVGYYSITIGQRVGPSGRVVSFEPNEEVCSILEANINLNEMYDYATVHKVALSNESGRAALHRSAAFMGSANIVAEALGGGSIDVEVADLDGLAIGQIDLLKLDAEGSEVPILRGAARTLAASPNCALMIEVGMKRWERFAALDEIIVLSGGTGRRAYLVRKGQAVEPIAPGDIRANLAGTRFEEEYIFVAQPHLVERYIPDLLRR